MEFAEGKSDNRYLFQGKELDAESGDYYFGARYYDAEAGRWLGRDPKEVNFSSYMAFGNNPLKYVDPDGNMPLIIIPIVIYGGAWIGAIAMAPDLQLDIAAASDAFSPSGTTSDKVAVGLALGVPILPAWAVKSAKNGVMDAGVYLYKQLPIVRLKSGLKFADDAVTKGYSSFKAFKREYGVAGKGNAWHHIVEQHALNIKRFGDEAIHNTKNLVKMQHKNLTKLHNKISKYYGTKNPALGMKTPREYLKDKSFKEQYEFGVDVINKIVSGEIKVNIKK